MLLIDFDPQSSLIMGVERMRNRRFSDARYFAEKP
jgi:hypothetical protein